MKECCFTCRKLYLEYGMYFCKVHDEPLDDLNAEKCSNYEKDYDLQEGE